MVTIRFMSLVGTFSVVRTEDFEDMSAARLAVEEHAKSAGYSNVRLVDEIDDLRFTAKTPGGRSGRNVAFVESDDWSTW